MKKKKVYYYRVELFSLGDLGGGCWEDDVIVSGRSPQEAYDNVLRLLTEKGYAFEAKITYCRRDGEDFF